MPSIFCTKYTIERGIKLRELKLIIVLFFVWL